jgi:hypothetical protein
MQPATMDGASAPISDITTITTIVAAPGAGYRIVVLGYKLQLDTDGEYLWSSASTALTGTMELAADAPDGAFFGAGIFACAPNETLRLTATTPANGWVRYVVQRV